MSNGELKIELTFDTEGNLKKVKRTEAGEEHSCTTGKNMYGCHWECKAICNVIPLALVEYENSPGHWCIIQGQLRWCP